MTPEELIARVRELDAKATKGPMKVEVYGTMVGDAGGHESYAQIEVEGHRESDPVVCQIWNPDDDEVVMLEAFAFYRTAAPTLASTLEAERAKVKVAREAIRHGVNRAYSNGDDSAAEYFERILTQLDQ